MGQDGSGHGRAALLWQSPGVIYPGIQIFRA